MQIADWNGKPRADFIRQEFVDPASAVSKALSDRFVVRQFRFSSVAQSDRRSLRPDIRRLPDPARHGARRRAPGARRAAARGHRARVGRCGHDGRVAVGRAAQSQGCLGAGFHRRHRPGSSVPRHPGQPHQCSPDGVEGNVSPGRRGHHANRLCGRDGLARRRGRRPDRRLAGRAAAGRRRARRGARALHGRRFRVAADPFPHRSTSRANRSRRTTRASRSSTSAIAARRSSTSKESRASSTSSSGARSPTIRTCKIIGFQRTADNKFYRHGTRQSGSARRRFSTDARRALRLSRPDSRQHRGRRVHRRSAAHDCGLRRAARRRIARPRRRTLVLRGKLCGDAGGRRAARRPRAAAEGR